MNFKTISVFLAGGIAALGSKLIYENILKENGVDYNIKKSLYKMLTRKELYIDKEIIVNSGETREQQLTFLKRKSFDITRIYVIMAKSQEHACKILTKACGDRKEYVLLGPSLPNEAKLFKYRNELPEWHHLYTFVLRRGLLLDSRGVFKRFNKKILGFIENAHWASQI